MSTGRQKVVILDFGSQYTQLIARRVRESKVFCEILPYNTTKPVVQDPEVRGIILSGGPCNVNEPGAPVCDRNIFSTPAIPVIGICYGMQLMTHVLGGEVTRSAKREFGRAKLSVDTPSQLFDGIRPEELDVWMSHSDSVKKNPSGFVPIASTQKIPFAAVSNEKENLFGLQFHPEVTHTKHGQK
ncbi:MAG: glutamine-hydrolyzing GMP synthase, partial [Nitrospinota bacterium]